MRDGRIDSLKGVLIALVVWGHCCLYGIPQDSVKIVIANYVYLFHMPFFVFLSGYFTYPNSKSFWKGMLIIFESYVVFQFIKGFIQGYSLIDYLTIPAPMMWYLWALLIWRLFAFLIIGFKISDSAKYIVLASLFVVLCHHRRTHTDLLIDKVWPPFHNSRHQLTWRLFDLSQIILQDNP